MFIHFRRNGRIRPQIYSDKCPENKEEDKPISEHGRKVFVVQAGPSKIVSEELVVEDIEYQESLSQVGVFDNSTDIGEDFEWKQAIDFVTNKIIENIKMKK